MERFHFKGFDPVESVRTYASAAYERILDAAPSDAHLTAVLEWDSSQYHCTMELGSFVWPAAVSVRHRDARAAIEKAERALLGKLGRWHEQRFTPLRGEARNLVGASA